MHMEATTITSTMWLAKIYNGRVYWWVVTPIVSLAVTVTASILSCFSNQLSNQSSYSRPVRLSKYTLCVKLQKRWWHIHIKYRILFHMIYEHPFHFQGQLLCTVLKVVQTCAVYIYLCSEHVYSHPLLPVPSRSALTQRAITPNVNWFVIL